MPSRHENTCTVWLDSRKALIRTVNLGPQFHYPTFASALVEQRQPIR